MITRSKSKQNIRSYTRSNHHDNDDPKSAAVRYDYSATYLENDDLEAELQDTRYTLQRRKYRASIEGEETLKTIKQNADKLLSLKDKVNKREPHESANKISNLQVSENHNGRIRRQLVSNKSPSETDDSKSDANAVDDDIKEDAAKETSSSATKAINNLTMFALAFRNFKASSRRNTHPDRDESDSDKEISNFTLHERTLGKIVRDTDSFKVKDTNKLHPDLKTEIVYSTPTRRMQMSLKCKRGGKGERRPATVPANSRRLSIDTCDSSEKAPKSQVYGINVQKDFTRSRRKLEEISRLEMDMKYKYENKYEARRQRLLADCKDNVTLNERIQKFLHDIDEFKKLDKPASALDKVLKRSKSAFVFRDMNN